MLGVTAVKDAYDDFVSHLYLVLFFSALLYLQVCVFIFCVMSYNTNYSTRGSICIVIVTLVADITIRNRTRQSV